MRTWLKRMVAGIVSAGTLMGGGLLTAGTANDGQAAGAAPLASTGAGTGPAIAVAGLLAMAGASLLAAVARTRRHGADPDGLTAD